LIAFTAIYFIAICAVDIFLISSHHNCALSLFNCTQNNCLIKPTKNASRVHKTNLLRSKAMPPNLVVLFLSLLLGTQPITTDLYLPALPAITEGFGATMGQAQLTLTALLLAFGASQLVWGPLSDRFGRRPILIIGLTAYAIGSLGSVFASSMELLIVWRAVQGAAMGAGVMCARAMGRDLYAPAEGARVMSKGLSGLGVIAFASAPLGGLLTQTLGWRAAMASLSVFGFITLALVVLRFKETLRVRNPLALQPATLLRTWGGILRHPTFWAYALLAITSYGGLFTFLAASSFVFIKVLGLSKTQYGFVMSIMSLSYISGTFLCRWLLARYGVQGTVWRGGCITLVAGSTLAGLAALGYASVASVLLPFCLFMLGHGIHQSCGQSGAAGPFPQAAGAASALSGFLMMLAAFAMGSWLGTHMDGTVKPLAYGVAFWSVWIVLTAWVLVQRYGQQPQH
jgi:MFS transporter, DHA1 family, multidrug resistance protein